ncbi:MAG: glycosyltransferase [Actinomycetota bacterium]
MFVRNAFEYDARVEREATALAAEGARVTVVALWDANRTKRREKRGSVFVRRVSRWFWLLDWVRAAWLRRARPEGGGAPERSLVAGGLNTAQRSWTTVGRIGAVDRVRTLVISIRMAVVGVLERADVYHAHDLNTLAAASWAARLRRARLVYDSHEIAPEQENIVDPAGTAKLERRLIARADAIIHTTPMRAKWAADEYGIPMPVVVRNVPNLRTRVEPIALAEHFGFPEGSKVLLHQGGMQPNRGIEVLIRSVALMDERFTLALVGPGRLRPTLEGLVAELNLQNRVRFHGPVPHEELLRFVAGAWCGFSLLLDTCLNHRWSLPNKLFECVAVGVPVIVSDNPEIAEFVIRNEVGETCDPADSSSIASAVHRLDERYEGAREAAARTAPTLRWEDESRNLIDLYHQVAGAPPKRIPLRRAARMR